VVRAAACQFITACLSNAAVSGAFDGGDFHWSTFQLNLSRFCP
jgi:hypothetical protein